ncbi:sensor histidine kinase [Leifsonia sp. 2MCAF36]|uniref:sensor histidine kinase n=1 Tax=Leifsonia sp. 2MCAF36 TaxID=3232988 RepID=UPI003F943DA7
MSSFLRRNRWLVEPVIAVAFFVLWAIEVVGRHQIAPGSLHVTLPFWAALLLLAAAIAFSRLRPVLAMVAGAVALIGQLLFPTAIFDEPLVYSGYVIVILVIAATTHGRMHAVTLAFAIGSGLSVAGLLSWSLSIGHDNAWTRALFFILCTGAAGLGWLAGTLIGTWRRKRTSELELERATSALRAAKTEVVVAEERERIAQDVHDIMAHSLSVILAQADGARLLAEERPTAVVPSLATIASTARSSLTEVRVLIETLVGTPDGPGHPGMKDLEELVQRLSDAGLTITVERFGDAIDLTVAQQLAVYRIVQEGLTNALKHAGAGATVRLALDNRDDGIAVSIASRPANEVGDPAAPNPAGRGVIGMRERARLAGGWLDAGADDDVSGGFLVAAYIPANGRSEVTP